MKRTILPALLAVVLLAGCGASTGSGGTEPATTGDATTAPAEGSSAPADEGTVSQQQALKSAQSYIEFGAFSKVGLMRQLTSDAGEGFPAADAKWAIAHLEVDWKAEAVESAQTYLDMGGFSRASLLQQLTSKAGEGFTKAEAEYAVKQVGL